MEAETGLFWVAFGENPWLLALLPASADWPQLLLAVDPSRLTASLHLEESDQGYAARDFRFHTDVGTEGESPGNGFRGLKISFAETVRKPASGIRSSQPLFYGLVLFVVLGLTLFGAYLLWKDIRRELSLAEMQSHFVSSVSHELKTPLTAIRMFAETLRLGRFKDPQTEHEYLDTIISESERLSRLLNNVLDLSKIEKGRKIYRPEPADLAAIARTAVRAMNYPLSQKGFNLHVDIEQGMPTACVDRDALEQAILNLLQNAMEYSGDAREIELRLRAAGQSALIQVADRGIGIEPGEQKRIFEKFYRIQSPENARLPGTGLGLAIVDHIARAHGGRVEVASIPGEGSTFSIILPLEKRS